MCLGASEINATYRDVILENHGVSIQHLHRSLEDLLVDKSCSLHDGASSCKVDGSTKYGGDINLGITGSPCNPYSTKRCKRFSNGNVASHSMSNITMESVITFYRRFEPKTGITEQVKGFAMRTSVEDPESPCDKFLTCTSVQFIV